MVLEHDSVSILLYTNIENMNELKDLLMKGELKAAIVNSELIYHTDLLMLASHKALYNAKNKSLKTKSINTELLYNLFPSRSIRDSLKTFGTQDSATSAIFVCFDEEWVLKLKDIVKGKLSSLDKINELVNENAVKKLYKIPASMTDQISILNFIITKISSKELLF
ncbi:EKC/KEOPS complex subunit TPRKB [Parasteatoda tepidariorum]|uniref:EKC/KEOPS complex subunit TPRKB n=1 Tax=Parasteatoda tepidariorum TaxID=114398 RepID=UPI001C720CFC|nr:EKC/KEOPS complex subunit TPRKB [Parasteatoda tepidariorum]